MSDDPPSPEAFAKQIAEQDVSAVTDDDQKNAGQPVAGSASDNHKQFAQNLYRLIDEGIIDFNNPDSLISIEVYKQMSEELQGKVDLIKANLINQIRLIDDLRKTVDPEKTIHLDTMIEQLWQMKQPLEAEHDVLVI